jgi:predicted AAA+ superfamily ATPase
MYFDRTLSNIVKNANLTFPVVLITGPRQVGKSTLFEKICEPDRTVLTLDDPKILALAKNDPALFLQTYKPPLFIDEIQYAPELFPYIKMAVDREKRKGMFWLTGSQPFHLMERVSESLAGRVAILELQGLSQAERFGRQGIAFVPDTLHADNRPSLPVNDVYELILKGSYPELNATPDMKRNLFYSSYLKTYIERDIRSLANITDERRFIQFISVVAARTAQLLNYDDMAKDVGASVNTIKMWISLLETSGLIYLLHPYHNNLTNRLIKTPKLYFLDTGLCSYLTGWDAIETISAGAMNGAFLETYVISEILKSYLHTGENANFYFYRDKEKREIDLLIERNGKYYPIEVKRSASPSNDDVRHFNVLEKLQIPAGKGAIVCLYEQLLPLNRDVDIVPISYLG